MVLQRSKGEASFADDLRPHVECGRGRLPFGPGEGWPRGFGRWLHAEFPPCAYEREYSGLMLFAG